MNIPATENLIEIMRRGFKLAQLGVVRARCPFDFDTAERAAWMYGWRLGKAAMREDQAKARAAKDRAPRPLPVDPRFDRSSRRGVVACF